MLKHLKKITGIIILTLLVSSCASKDKMLYLQNKINRVATDNYETQLKPDDILLIVVSSDNPEASQAYNLEAVTMQGTSETGVYQRRLQTYIIDKNGSIDFPNIGSVKLAGLTKTQAVLFIKELLKDHIKNPIVNIRILNYEVTVLGEVNRPGAISIDSERLTLLEALGKAGDLTVYGNRKNIMLIREEDGKTTSHKIDITKSNFVNSPYYFLQQNDVVYVEPNQTRVNSSVIGPNLTVGISALSLIVTIIALTLR
ncbi:polysaccharide biosynthesis/export family protein [Flavobacterium sp.]|uniref:polysaccharide biosynthesis/export family protein n=1 Tax=Flavobacterium sp. TaxID=239 RepID=UPI003529838A